MQPVQWWMQDIWPIMDLAVAVSGLSSQAVRASHSPHPFCWKFPNSAGLSMARGYGRSLAMPGRLDDGGSYA